nr:polyketide cyclase [Sinorhizobium sp. M14]
MREPSMMMLGARMIYELDERAGRATGSVIKMHGSLLGLPLSVEEVIVDRRPPHRKTWRTFGRTRLAVIGAHQVGFEIMPAKGFCRLRIFINFNYPSSILGKLIGMMFGGAYARWCLRRMSEEAAAQFQPSVVAP